MKQNTSQRPEERRKRHRNIYPSHLYFGSSTHIKALTKKAKIGTATMADSSNEEPKPTPPSEGLSNGNDGASHENIFARFVDSFRRDPNACVTRKEGQATQDKQYDLEAAVANTASSPLQRKLKGRHLQMIAIGGSIGELALSIIFMPEFTRVVC